MGMQAMGDQHEHGHLVGDVPALLLVAVVLWYLSPKKITCVRELRPSAGPFEYQPQFAVVVDSYLSLSNSIFVTDACCILFYIAR